MDKIESAIQTIHKLDHNPNETNAIIHPLVKLLLTITYIILLTSINKYNLTTTLAMSIYLILISFIQEIPVREILKRFKIIFLLLFFIGIANPIIDKDIIMYIGHLPVTTGEISLITLMLKGLFAIISSFILISTTKIEEICYSFKLLHIPNMLITTFLLTYRYIILFLKETHKIWIAYQMRAPNQKGIRFKAWGSMIGSLTIRSIDKANTIYDSMELRGFDPENFFIENIKFNKKSLNYLILGLGIMFILRYIPIFDMLGKLFI